MYIMQRDREIETDSQREIPKMYTFLDKPLSELYLHLKIHCYCADIGCPR